MKSQQKQRKAYIKPEIAKVKLEDRRVVAMATCKTSPNDRGCMNGEQPGFVLDPS